MQPVFVQPRGWGGTRLSGVPLLLGRGVRLGTSFGPTLLALKWTLRLSGASLPFSPLPPKRRRVPVSLPWAPVSPCPREEQERGLMEANPYFGCCLLAGWGSGIRGVELGVLPQCHGAAGRGARSCLRCRRAPAEPAGTATNHNFARLLRAWPAAVPPVSGYLGL